MQVSQLRLGLLRLLCFLEDDSEVLGLAAGVWSECLILSSALSVLVLALLALSSLVGASLAGFVSEAGNRGMSWSMPPHIEWKL